MYRTIATNVLLFAVTVCLLTHLAMIWVLGDFIIYEPNTVILTAETYLLVTVAAFAVANLVREWRRGSNQ